MMKHFLLAAILWLPTPSFALPLLDTLLEAVYIQIPPPSPTLGTDERMCLAHIIYHEARGESVYGQMAVASVVHTRAVADRWSDTICGNAKWPHAFSFVHPDTKAIPTVEESDAWTQAWLVAGLIKEPLPYLPGVDHYHTTGVNPFWNASMEFATEIGNHRFFRDPDTQYAAITPILRPKKDTS